MSTNGKLARALFGVAMLSALGMGTAQALAATTEPASARLACGPKSCDFDFVLVGLAAGRA